MARKIPFIVASGPSFTNITDVAGSHFKDKYFGTSLERALEVGNFLAFIPSLSTYAFLPDFKAPHNPGYHIFDLIDQRILAAASDGKCILVFDTSSEGDPIVEAGYANLHAWLDTHKIPRSMVVIVNQNRSYSSIYKSLYGDGIKFLVYDSYIKRILKIFSSDNSEFNNILGFDRSRTKFRGRQSCGSTFLSLNGAPRANRIVFVAGMMQRGLLESTIWSMLGQKSGKLPPSYHDALLFRSKIGMDWISDKSIEDIMHEMPRFVPIENAAISAVSGSDALALKINADLYDLAFCSVATETEFTDGSVQRISELSLKPIMMGHPLISVGNPGSLRLIREIGFQTFATGIDEAYDEIADPGERLLAVYHAMETLQRDLQGDAAERVEGDLRSACEHNARFAAGPAINAYEASVEKNLFEGLFLHQTRVWGAA